MIKKEKRIKFPILRPTLIFEKELQPDTRQVLRIQGQAEWSSNSPLQASFQPHTADGSVCACECLNTIALVSLFLQAVFKSY